MEMLWLDKRGIRVRRLRSKPTPVDPKPFLKLLEVHGYLEPQL